MNLSIKERAERYKAQKSQEAKSSIELVREIGRKLGKEDMSVEVFENKLYMFGIDNDINVQMELTQSTVRTIDELNFIINPPEIETSTEELIEEEVDPWFQIREEISSSTGLDDDDPIRRKDYDAEKEVKDSYQSYSWSGIAPRHRDGEIRDYEWEKKEKEKAEKWIRENLHINPSNFFNSDSL